MRRNMTKEVGFSSIMTFNGTVCFSASDKGKKIPPKQYVRGECLDSFVTVMTFAGMYQKIFAVHLI